MKNTNLILGKINSGKTKGILFKEVTKSIENNENLVILDNKKEYYGNFKKLLDNNNYTTLVLNLKETNKSNSFNPLYLPYIYYKNRQKDKAVSLLEELSLEIFKEDNNNIDPFWANSASSYFITLALILFKEGTEEEINIGSIQAISTLAEKKIDDKSIINRYFDTVDILDPIYISGSPIIFSPYETKASILSVFKQKINSYCIRETLLNNLCNNEINLNNLKNKTAIFIIGEEKVNSIANILINQLVNKIEENKMKFTFYLDNLLELPVILQFKNIIEKSTYLNIKTYITSTNQKELEDKYGKYLISKIENIIELNEKIEIKLIENTADYPNTIIKQNKYFNIEQFVKDNIINN